MTYKVKLNASGHEFIAHPKESILEAGLRAGYNLRYQCDNGSCGECLSWLLTGDIRPIGFSDYAIPEADKARGGFLMCANQACSDLEIQAEEYDQASQMPDQEIPARVKKISREHDDIIVLQLRTPRTNTFRFLAGQCAQIEIPGGETRTFEIASCPCNGMLLEFHVRYHDDDAFSEYMFNQLIVGETLFIKGPMGNFILNEDGQRPLLFIAYDTGFAGIKSLVEHAIALEIPQPIYLYRIACEPNRDYLDNLCRSWADALDNLRYEQFKHCVPLDCSESEEHEVCQQFLAVLDQGGEGFLSRCEVYLSGVDRMVGNLRIALRRHGLADKFIHSQRVY